MSPRYSVIAHGPVRRLGRILSSLVWALGWSDHRRCQMTGVQSVVTL